MCKTKRQYEKRIASARPAFVVIPLLSLFLWAAMILGIEEVVGIVRGWLAS